MPTDKIFTEHDDYWWYNVVLDSKWSKGWMRYASGYRQAANIVVAAVGDEGAAYQIPAYPDAVGFPVAFCYRALSRADAEGCVHRRNSMPGQG